MKQSESHRQAVIMCGISGSGKTYYARKLEKEGYIRLSVDNLIWNKVGPKLFNLSKGEQRSLFSQCRQEINNQFINLLKSGRQVVMDATHCKRAIRDEIRRECSEIGVKPVFAYCHAEKEVLWKRLSERRGTGPDDLIVTHEELSDYWVGFEQPEGDETDFIFLDQQKNF